MRRINVMSLLVLLYKSRFRPSCSWWTPSTGAVFAWHYCAVDSADPSCWQASSRLTVPPGSGRWSAPASGRTSGASASSGCTEHGVIKNMGFFWPWHPAKKDVVYIAPVLSSVLNWFFWHVCVCGLCQRLILDKWWLIDLNWIELFVVGRNVSLINW